MQNLLTAIKIKKSEDGKLFDGGGLLLVKKGKGGKWVYRYTYLEKRREMGLGAYPAVGLADARAQRDHWMKVLASGRNPIDVKRQDAEQAQKDAQRADPTFEELVTIVFNARKATLRGGGTRGRWRSPLDLYMIPAFGKKRGSQLTAMDVADALSPIWHSKYPTAEKAIQRTRIVLRSAKRMTFPTDPDIVESAIEILGAVSHVVEHTPFVPWQEIPDLYAALPNTRAGWCNRWIILNVTRMHASRGARVDEVDEGVWTVPADRMKGQEGAVSDFRVPLSDPAIEIVDKAREFGQDYLFPGERTNRPITDAAVEKCLREMKVSGTPHGFRTSFRMWQQETEACSYDVAETILSHTVGNKVVRSYARSDLLDRRRVAMQKWARFVTGVDTIQSLNDGNVITMRR